MLLFSVVIPQVQDIFYARDRVSVEQATLQQLNNKLQFLSNFDIENFTQQNDRLNTILPSTKPFLPLLHSLKQLALDQGVIFSGLDWSVGLVASESAEAETTTVKAPTTTKAAAASTKDEQVSKMQLELKVLGSTERLNAYFDAMTKMAPAVEIDSVDLAPKFQIQPGMYEGSLKLSAYFAPLASLRGSVTGDQPLPKLTQEQTDYIQSLVEYKIYTEDIQSGAGATPSAQRANPFAL